MSMHMDSQAGGGYLAGIDGGGTKTLVAVGDLETGAVHEQVFGPVNLNSAGIEKVRQTLGEITAYLDSRPGGLAGCRGGCIGAAGISNPALREALFQMGAALHAPLYIKGDHEIALAGAFCGEPGILLIAGTGSVCCGINRAGETARAGGWGHVISDEGSGYAIGRDLLAAVGNAADSGRPTVFTPLVYERLGVHSMPELVRWLYHAETTKKEIASLSPLLELALEQGDAAARHILNKAAKQLCLLVSHVAERLLLSTGPVAFAGSVLANSVPLLAAVEQALVNAGFCVQKAALSPVEGALLLAGEAAGVNWKNCRIGR